ncbi:MAG: hypothetical protein ABSC10_13380 [Candidatus Acidiferrales bacterium]
MGRPPSRVIVSTGGHLAAPQCGPLSQISVTQPVLLPQPPAPESAVAPQCGATNHAAQNDANLIGTAAIGNRSNPMKINGALPF